MVIYVNSYCFRISAFMISGVGYNFLSFDPKPLQPLICVWQRGWVLYKSSMLLHNVKFVVRVFNPLYSCAPIIIGIFSSQASPMQSCVTLRHSASNPIHCPHAGSSGSLPKHATLDDNSQLGDKLGKIPPSSLSVKLSNCCQFFQLPA